MTSEQAVVLSLCMHAIFVILLYSKKHLKRKNVACAKTEGKTV